MYRIFTMNREGQLYQLSSVGWVVRDGTSWPELRQVKDFIDSHKISPVRDTVDAFVAQVDRDGLIMTTTTLETNYTGKGA